MFPLILKGAAIAATAAPVAGAAYSMFGNQPITLPNGEIVLDGVGGKSRTARQRIEQFRQQGGVIPDQISQVELADRLSGLSNVNQMDQMIRDTISESNRLQNLRSSAENKQLNQAQQIQDMEFGNRKRLMDLQYGYQRNLGQMELGLKDKMSQREVMSADRNASLNYMANADAAIANLSSTNQTNKYRQSATVIDGLMGQLQGNRQAIVSLLGR